MYPTEWREYRRWHLRATYGMLGLPAAVLIAIILKIWAGVESPVAFIALVVTWAILWGWVAFKSVRVPCPRCGSAFLAGQDTQFQTKRSCVHCGLGLYEQP